ncbi:MAG: hypothetical protein E7G49_03800 [Cutibacterium granulosum]|nr:hypothetical protein [Cutibacterium granulosum]
MARPTSPLHLGEDGKPRRGRASVTTAPRRGREGTQSCPAAAAMTLRAQGTRAQG